MRFSAYYKEHLLAFNKETKEAFKLLSVKPISEKSYEVKALDRSMKLDTFILEKNDVRKFKFIRRKNMGRTVVEFEEILCLLNEENTVGGAFGDGVSSSGADQFSSDWYAKGDARNVWGGIPAKVQRRNLRGIESFTKSRKKKNKKKKKKDSDSKKKKSSKKSN